MRTSKRERIELPKRLDYNPLLEKAAEYNKNHRNLLEFNKEAGCYYCCNFFLVSDVKEWIDKETTALCPKCWIDSVIPNVNNSLTVNILKAMYEYWFAVSAYSFRMKDGQIVDIVDEDDLYDPVEFATYRERQLAKLQESR